MHHGRFSLMTSVLLLAVIFATAATAAEVAAGRAQHAPKARVTGLSRAPVARNGHRAEGRPELVARRFSACGPPDSTGAPETTYAEGANDLVPCLAIAVRNHRPLAALATPWG